MTAFLFVTFILRKSVPAASQQLATVTGAPNPFAAYNADALREDPLTGPAWQICPGVTPDSTALSYETCFICRNGGVAADAINTHFFGPDGPGSASFARVRIGGVSQEDLFVAVKPLKGSLPVAPVNWRRMVLTCMSINPERGVYEAILDITPDEAARCGITND